MVAELVHSAGLKFKLLPLCTVIVNVLTMSEMKKNDYQNLSPFLVPPPKLTFHGELLKKNYELQISNLESQVKLQREMISSKVKKLSGPQARRLNELIKEMENKQQKDHT